MYLLDTNICIYIKRHQPPQVLEKFHTLQPQQAFMSVITFAELMYGALKSQQVAGNLSKLVQFSELIPVLTFEKTAAEVYGQIRTELEKRGHPIGANDMLIAAHALSLDFILVTNNEREFLQVRGLKMENWLVGE